MKFAKVALFLSGWLALGGYFLMQRGAKEVVVEGPAPVVVKVTGVRAEPEVVEDVDEGEVVESRFAEVYEKWAGKGELRSALLGFVLLDEEGEVVYASELGETALCPASTLKTLTTGAAFGMLGPEFRYATRLVMRADGDLALVGSGDPTLNFSDLEKMAAAAVKGGLKEVAGKLVVDATVFSAPPVNDHWNWGDIGNAYGAGAFGVNVEHNRMRVRFQPGGKVGDAAKLMGEGRVAPGTRWVNEVRTGAAGSGDGVSIYSSPGSREIVMRGTVPLGGVFAVNGAIPDPPAVALEVLRAALEKEGVVFGSGSAVREGKDKILAVHYSEPLPVIVDHLHKVSDNLESQCLFLTMGNLAKKSPVQAVREYWEEAGVKFEGLRLIDGSGLARANMIRPLDLARVNLAARKGPHGERFFQSLNASHGGRVRAKLGSMSGVKTDVGFVKLKSGQELTFAIMANGLNPGLHFWPLRDELLEELGKVGE